MLRQSPKKNTGRVCRILLFDLGFSSFIPFKCHVAAMHVCAYTQIHPLCVCACVCLLHADMTSSKAKIFITLFYARAAASVSSSASARAAP